MISVNSFLIGAMTVILVVLILVAEHRVRRKIQRRCPECRRIWGVRRKYQMVENRRSGYTGECQDYQTFIFTVCRCGSVRCIRSENRWFPIFEIRWRKFWNCEQFFIDPKLFTKSGIDLTSKNLDFHRTVVVRNRHRIPASVVHRLPKAKFDPRSRN